MAEKRLITAALPYINNIPHLGHIVGSHLPGDIFARFCRLKGYDVLYVGGSDENGTPCEIAAKQIGVSVTQLCDTLFVEHKKSYDWFNISYDIFSRTSKEIHHETTQEFFKKVHEHGHISEGTLDQYYCASDDMYLADRYVEGTCPSCGYEHANGDQCEKCTNVIHSLKDPKCLLCKGTPELRTQKHLFFKLDDFSEKLELWLKDQGHWRSQVTALALGWIKEGLRERCITRDLKHGVRVPLEGYEDKVFYVWFDAPIGYVSATKELTSDWELYWKSDCKIYHFLGKDNIPFHTIFWPALMMAEGSYSLPHHVVGLQYLNYEGGKFSKSKKRGVFCEALQLTGMKPDYMRAYLTYLIPETDDTEFKWVEFQERLNEEVLSNFGNFVNRTLTFVHSKMDGKVTQGVDEDFQNIVSGKVLSVDHYFEKVELRSAFTEIMALSKEGNKYFNDTAPWKLIKEDPEQANVVLYQCVSLCKTLSVLIAPFMPSIAEELWGYLGLEGSVHTNGNWNVSVEDSYTVNKPSVLFEKITDEMVEEFKEKASQGRDVKEFF